jgi:hypothetical protein
MGPRRNAFVEREREAAGLSGLSIRQRITDIGLPAVMITFSRKITRRKQGKEIAAGTGMARAFRSPSAKHQRIESTYWTIDLSTEQLDLRHERECRRPRGRYSGRNQLCY